MVNNVKCVQLHILSDSVRSMQYEDMELQSPGTGQVEIRNTAIAVTRLDVEVQHGLAFAGAAASVVKSPFLMGLSGAGVITEVGSGVLNFQIGQRVAYTSMPKSIRSAGYVGGCIGIGDIGPDGVNPPLGSYCEARVLGINSLVPLPPYISDEIGAAVLLRGLTARMLVKNVACLKRGQKVLVHSASGGVGSLVCQWAASLGAFVIGTVGSEKKVELAKQNKCHRVLVLEEGRHLIEQVLDMTYGEGVTAVFDLLGKATLEISMGCLMRKGMLISAGAASGEAPSFHLFQLAGEGSIFVTSPLLGDYITSHEELLEAATEVFDLLKSNQLRFSIDKTYPLKFAAKAHDDSAAGSFAGGLILVPHAPDPKDMPHGS